MRIFFFCSSFFNQQVNAQVESHAHHHMHASRSLDMLLHHDKSLEHSACFSFMVLLSLVLPCGLVLWIKDESVISSQSHF